MGGSLHFGPGLFDQAVFTDEEGHAVDAIEGEADEFFLAPDTVGFGDFQVGIGQQGEGQGIFGGKLGVGLDGVSTDAEQGDALGLELGKVIAEAAGFLGAPGRAVFRVEIEDDGAAFEVWEGDGLAVLGLGGEVRGRGAGHDRVR